MSERARHIVLLGRLILGIVGPFVVGAIAERSVAPAGNCFTVRDSSAGRFDDYDDREVWYGFDSKATPVDRGGIKYWLDCQHVLARAKLSNKPVFLYFTGTNDVNAVYIHRKVLRAPAVVALLRHYECAVLFVDAAPSRDVDRAEAQRMVERNGKLLDELLGQVPLPGFAVVQPDFNNRTHLDSSQPLVQANLWDVQDEASAAQLLAEALAKWTRSRAREQEFPPFHIRYSKDSAGRTHIEMDDKPDNLVLLVSHPEVIEPELTRGRWLVLLYSVLSSDSVKAAYNSPDLARRLTGIAGVAIRATNAFEGTTKWLPDFERYSLKGHPFWFVFENGIVVRRYEGWMDIDEAVRFAQE